jgi:15-cis-phytoene synthase
MTGNTLPVTAPVAAEVDRDAAAVMARAARTFDLAARFLPGHRRADVRRLYLLLRTLDDLVDEGRPEADRRVEAVERWVGAGGAAAPTSPETSLLADLVRRHPDLPLGAVGDFCAGMRADLRGPDHADDAALDAYCYQVAGTVGRLMAAVLGVEIGAEDEADDAARRLGAAMQRTNVLRDIVEDARAGRVYLSADSLAGLGLSRETAALELARLDRWSRADRRTLLEPQVERADADYAAGLDGVPFLRSGGRAVRVAGHLYREILRQIERDSYGGSGRRAVVPRWRKASIIARRALRVGR